MNGKRFLGPTLPAFGGVIPLLGGCGTLYGLRRDCCFTLMVHKFDSIQTLLVRDILIYLHSFIAFSRIYPSVSPLQVAVLSAVSEHRQSRSTQRQPTARNVRSSSPLTPHIPHIRSPNNIKEEHKQGKCERSTVQDTESRWTSGQAAEHRYRDQDGSRCQDGGQG